MLKIEKSINGNKNSRVCTVSLNAKKFLTPFYFPSITTAETRSDITETMDIIIKTGYPSILISCYDLYNLDKLTRTGTAQVFKLDEIDKFHQNGGIVLLDSGEFENYHFKGKWIFSKYKKTIKKIKSDFFTSFDKTPSPTDEQYDIDKFSYEYIPKSQSVSNDKVCIAVSHGASPNLIPSSISEILKTFPNTCMIAIPERELGRTLTEHCQTLFEIRKTIRDLNKDTLVHILGCGNPISISALSYAGADSFDAVDWCRWSINPKTLEYGSIGIAKLYDCTCVACGAKMIDERMRAWRHNLEFYDYFLQRLRRAIEKSMSIESFLESENVDKSVITNLSKIF